VFDEEVNKFMAANECDKNILQNADENVVVLIAEKAFHEFYRSLTLHGRPLRLCTPKDAQEVLHHIGADVILIDCGFDIPGGLKLLKAIKAAHASIPVVFLTERPINAAREAYQSGARRFFEKPLDLRELRDTVETLLKIRKSSVEKRDALASLHETEIESPAGTLTTDKPVPVVRAIQYIENNLSERISLDTLAKEANMSKFHFCRLFSHHMGMTPIQFAAFFRIEKAKQLLTRGDLTVSAIALEVGFNDLGPFLRQFKKVTGITPSAYKKAMSTSRKKSS
jgi:two-component system response regulator YesN